MSKNLSQKFYLLFLVSVSLFGLFLVTLPAVFPLPVEGDFQWRKPLMGSAFGLICLLGIIAVFFPDSCSTIFQTDNIENKDCTIPTDENTAYHKISTIFGLKVTHGHHPGCKGFAAHEFQIGRKTLCTACMGLLLGSLITLFGITAYFFLGWNIGENISLFLISGVLGVGLGLFQYMFFNIRWRLLRFLLNAFFVSGTFLVLAGIDAVANSLVLDSFVVFLSVFWLFTRILLSKHIHNKICQTCNLKCNVYKK
jgi:hypothetical protein